MLGCMVAVISHTARSPRTEGNNQGTRQMNPVVQAWIIILLIIGYESYCSEQCELDLYQHDQSDAYPCPIPVLVTASAFVYISIRTQLKSVDSLRTEYNRVPRKFTRLHYVSDAKEQSISTDLQGVSDLS